MKISINFFFSTLNECTLHSLHATRINLRREPIIQRCRGHWHKRAAMLWQLDGTIPVPSICLIKGKFVFFMSFLMRLFSERIVIFY